ncbi:hypothetical protein LZD49_04910 [Dyadobacter sp. CY261]|uniref:hypothetical protein n=1 Tax=Dyadobacter sp. CY261 TaxID=2907203 RepID=UPI001F3672FA|nr:hypothetical protein [Dyadobacter sp. CY261]MCF0069801.1 hypothetical protein [Dyadobacter sp. CY261]
MTKINRALYACSFILIIFVVSKVSKSNSAEVDYTATKPDRFGGTGGDIPAIVKLNEMVEENFLNRDYYEVSAFETRSWFRFYANYNKRHRALLIGTADGWSSFFYATPQELDSIADHKIPVYKFREFLRPFPTQFLGDIPTRSRDSFSIF